MPAGTTAVGRLDDCFVDFRFLQAHISITSSFVLFVFNLCDFRETPSRQSADRADPNVEPVSRHRGWGWWVGTDDDGDEGPASQTRRRTSRRTTDEGGGLGSAPPRSSFVRHPSSTVASVIQPTDCRVAIVKFR